MTYIVIAYRWGNLNEQMTLFASQSESDCAEVAEYYTDYRGGKYGCAVMSVLDDLKQAMKGDCIMKTLHYFPSMQGESRPTYNHRCDVFNSPLCAIIHDMRYPEAPQWIQDIIAKAEEMANRRNEREARNA